MVDISSEHLVFWFGRHSVVHVDPEVGIGGDQLLNIPNIVFGSSNYATNPSSSSTVSMELPPPQSAQDMIAQIRHTVAIAHETEGQLAARTKLTTAAVLSQLTNGNQTLVPIPTAQQQPVVSPNQFAVPGTPPTGTTDI